MVISFENVVLRSGNIGGLCFLFSFLVYKNVTLFSFCFPFSNFCKANGEVMNHEKMLFSLFPSQKFEN